MLYLYKFWVRTAMQGIIEKLSWKANASEYTQRFYNPPDAQNPSSRNDKAFALQIKDPVFDPPRKCSPIQVVYLVADEDLRMEKALILSFEQH